MRIVHFETHGIPGIAADEGSGWHGLTQRDSGFPGTLPELIAQGADLLRIGRSLGQSPAIEQQRSYRNGLNESFRREESALAIF